MRKTIQHLYETFAAGAEPTGLPFWAWNDRLDKEELLRQVHDFKAMNMRGFFMHSRTGLDTEYLGDEWFELINACADEAEKLGMEAWLYDEDRWPSGTAGGAISANPEFRMRYMRLQVLSAGEFQWRERLLGVWSCRLNGWNYRELRQLQPGELPDAACSVLVFDIVEMPCENFYNGFTYIDTMNPEAVDAYLESTHRKYVERCQDRIPRSIFGIFTDEPHRGSLLDGFGLACEEGHLRAPYTPKLFAEFQRRFGYSLLDRLPELFLLPEGETLRQVKYHYVELLTELFLENFMKKYQEFCREHSLPLTGHVLHEDNLAAQVAMNGSVMRCYEYMDVPGVDVLTVNNFNFWIAKQLQSVARQLGKKHLLSETYGVTGWAFDLQGHKVVGDWQALFGINRRCHHLSWYSMRAEGKRDYPGSIFKQSSWYQLYGNLERYFSRVAEFLDSGVVVCEVLVFNPVESLWGQIFPGWSHFLSATGAHVQELEKEYRETFHALQDAQIDFDYGDEALLAKYARVERDARGAKFIVGQMAYRVLVVSGMDTMRASSLALCREFLALGGTIIGVGTQPGYIEALASEEWSRLQVPVTEIEQLAQAVRSCLPDRATLENGVGIFMQQRELLDGYLIAVLNVDRENGRSQVRLKLPRPGALESWDPHSGKALLVQPYAEHVDVDMDFLPGEMKFFVLRPESGKELEAPKDWREGAIDTARLAFRLAEPNCAVLDLVRWRLEEGERSSRMGVLAADQEVRRALHIPLRGGDMLQPWFVRRQRNAAGRAISVEYDFAIEEMPDCLFLAMEEPEHFRLNLNGTNFQPKFTALKWVDHAFHMVELPADLLQKGRNLLTLTTDYSAQSNLEAVYLLGDFGVKLQGDLAVLIAPASSFTLGDWREQGIPFYGAMVEVDCDFSIPEAATEMRVSLERDASYAAATVEYEGVEYDLSYLPRTAVIAAGKSRKLTFRLYFSRFNTFGPIHATPLVDGVCGPNHYLTTGENFSLTPILRPIGLFRAPEVQYRL